MDSARLANRLVCFVDFLHLHFCIERIRSNVHHPQAPSG